MRLKSRLYLYGHFRSKKKEKKKKRSASFKSNIEHNSYTELKEISISKHPIKHFLTDFLNIF